MPHLKAAATGNMIGARNKIPKKYINMAIPSNIKKEGGFRVWMLNVKAILIYKIS